MYDRHDWQVINQMYAAAGLPVVMPDDWDSINAMAAQMDQMLADNPLEAELSGNPLAQAVASEIVCFVFRPRTIDPYMLFDPDPPYVDHRWCGEDQQPVVRVLVVSRRSGEPVWVPLTEPGQWLAVAQAYAPDQLCSAHNHPGCDYFTAAVTPTPEKPLRAYVIPRSENAVIIYVCPTCRERMNNPSFLDEDYIGRGALPWYDTAPPLKPGADDDDGFLLG
ncbi:hypothetical protein [Mycobacteroides abscessus]|uniref:hypothetical protein n=1 Tax=Mycobacteroides abscessus TaxID=36809 RepID=UPI000928D344|nr:hypothetical protein [Mycobacteroides abscessus]SHQ74660.1 Uncharacterised protein [Mycobacteroides abscessus subsp. abscessus]SHS96129.1 Uncharacterised protein [Mycobacteroides abscessus subsp. abscessus]SHT26440.1 Uncharacterised protein [Mycobacteroides abscessus subsp. abscessus]SKG75581.1 Uncharacterised protein [Mycobacteroides abscessus subsp. abscessus]